jgi:hypothetical protein
MTVTPQETENVIASTNMRLADMEDIMGRLVAERQRRLDLVVNRRTVTFSGGQLMVLPGDHTQLVGDGGVTSVAGVYRPSVTAIETAGKMLGADVGFLKKLYDEGRTDIADAIWNGRMHGDVSGYTGIPGVDAENPQHPPFGGSFMLRLLRADGSAEGSWRAMLSDRFNTTMDNLDVAAAVLEGITESGVEAIPDACSLTDRKMHMRFTVPSLALHAPELLKGYHSPLDGPGGVARAGTDPDRPGMRLRVERGGWSVPRGLATAAREGMSDDHVVFAGLVVTNGDVGGSSRTIAPQIRIRICKNGLTLLAEGDRRVHLGSTQSEGVIDYALDTKTSELELIAKQTRDAVRKFMEPDWFRTQVQEIEALAGTPMPEPEAKITNVTKTAKYGKAEIEGVIDMWKRSGAVPSVGGLGNAVTAYSQVVADPDRAAQMDAQALPMMKDLAKALRAVSLAS